MRRSTTEDIAKTETAIGIAMTVVSFVISAGVSSAIVSLIAMR